MAAPPARTEICDTYPAPSNAVARTGFGKLYDYVTGLLGATGDSAEARAALVAAKSGANTDITSANAVTGIGNTRATDITISAAGEVTMPLQPAFLAYVNTQVDNVTGDGTSYAIVFNTEVFDRGGDYNVATGIFTAPVTGLYRFSTKARLAGLSVSTHIPDLQLVTSNRTVWEQPNPATSATQPLSIDVLVDMDAGDTAKVNVRAQSGTKIVDVSGDASALYTYFSGELVA